MNWLLISSLFCTLLYPVEASPDHAIYISVISVEHEQGSQKATVRFKIFKDDLNDAVFNASRRRHAFNEIENVDYQTDIINYLNQHFRLSINTQQTALEPALFEIQSDAAFISCTATTPAVWNRTEIETTLLYELFPTQQNMIHFRDGKIKQFARLSSGDHSVVFE